VLDVDDIDSHGPVAFKGTCTGNNVGSAEWNTTMVVHNDKGGASYGYVTVPDCIIECRSDAVLC
jgi:hypothetical protein